MSTTFSMDATDNSQTGNVPASLIWTYLGNDLVGFVKT